MITSLHQKIAVTSDTKATAKPVPKVRDDVELDGGHYFLSRKQNSWAIRKDGDWMTIDNSFNFVYLGKDKYMSGQSKWRVEPKVKTK